MLELTYLIWKATFYAHFRFPTQRPELDPASIYDPLTACALLMSGTTSQTRLPRYATLNTQASVERAARSTNAGYYNLLPGEETWRDRQPLLQKCGYILRKRYSPQWKPSWIGTPLVPTYCEDSVMLLVGEHVTVKAS